MNAPAGPFSEGSRLRKMHPPRIDRIERTEIIIMTVIFPLSVWMLTRLAEQLEQTLPDMKFTYTV